MQWLAKGMEGHRSGTRQNIPAITTTVKVMEGHQSGGQENFETWLLMNERFRTASNGDHLAKGDLLRRSYPRARSVK